MGSTMMGGIKGGFAGNRKHSKGPPRLPGELGRKPGDELSGGDELLDLHRRIEPLPADFQWRFRGASEAFQKSVSKAFPRGFKGVSEKRFKGASSALQGPCRAL